MVGIEDILIKIEEEFIEFFIKLDAKYLLFEFVIVFIILYIFLKSKLISILIVIFIAGFIGMQRKYILYSSLEILFSTYNYFYNDTFLIDPDNSSQSLYDKFRTIKRKGDEL